MPVDTWFPLAVYYADLEQSQTWNPVLLDRIGTLHDAAGARRTAETTSWTGDVHNVDRLHLDPAFDWLTHQVGTHARAYLTELGHDLTRTDLYIQRAWPVLAQRGQQVSRHAHHTAHLSAVYYVAAPDDPAAGKTRFFNDASPNELAAGIGSAMTGGYAQYNALNFGSVEYRPTPGRLLLFPAKQSHAVDDNDTDSVRVSISYDLVITSRGGAEDGRHEFLMPPPFLWRRIDDVGDAPPIDTERCRLAARATRMRPSHAFTLPDATGHPLWETRRFAHVASSATLADRAIASSDLAGVACAFDPPGDRGVVQDAIDRLHAWLLQADIPMHDATLSAFTVSHGGEAVFERGAAHLCCYLRLDCAPAACAVTFGEGGSEALLPGDLVVVSGFRRQRLDGAGQILCVDIDLPAVARVAVLRLPSMRLDGVEDAVVFAAATAQPLTHPLPSPADLFERLRWYADRKARRARHEGCAAVRRFLIDHADPADATAAEIALVRGHGSGRGGGMLIDLPDTLTDAECALLRRHADAHVTSIVPDTVDDLPEYQVNLDAAALADLLGEDRAAALLALPERIGATAGMPCARIDIFLRRYSPDSRADLAFHSDVSDYTLNIALDGDGAMIGGRLLALDDGGLRIVSRAAGTAILHAGDLVHGVSRIERGTRHSLIVFFHERDKAGQCS